MIKRAASESQLVTAILKALTMKGIFAWRANSGTQVIGATSKAARRVIRGAPAGTPDILLVLPERHEFVIDDGVTIGAAVVTAGTLAGLEVKTKTGQLRPSQRLWHAKAAQHGVRVAVVRSIGDALATVESWRTGRSVMVNESPARAEKGEVRSGR